MSVLFLISNIVEACIWIIAGVILLFVQTGLPTPPHARAYLQGKRYLAAVFLLGGLSVIVALSVGKYQGGRIEILNIYSLLNFYAGTVCMMLAFISLYNYKEFTGSSLLWIFGPVAGLLLLYVVVALIFGSPNVYSLTEYSVAVGASPALIIRTLILLAVVAGIVTVTMKFFQARKAYNTLLKDYFSGEEELRRSQWIDQSFNVMLVSFVFIIGSYLIASPYYDLAYGTFLTAVVIYFTVKFINYQHQFLRIAPAVEFASGEITEPVNRPDSAVGIMLVQWTSRPDKPYLMPGLSLGDLSQMTGVNKRRLSEHINGRFGMTFNAWINSLRIREVEQMLQDGNCGKTLSEIAYMTGFADLAAMSNAFKKVKGISPSHFRQQIKA